jgi:hypothetical protein
MTYPKDVLDHHLKCFGEGGLENHLRRLLIGCGVIHARRVSQRLGCNRSQFQHMVSQFTKRGTQSTCERVRRRDRHLCTAERKHRSAILRYED